MKLTSPTEMTYNPLKTNEIIALIEAELAKDKIMQNIILDKYEKTVFIPYKLSNITYDERYAIKEMYILKGWASINFFDVGDNYDITQVNMITNTKFTDITQLDL